MYLPGIGQVSPDEVTLAGIGAGGVILTNVLSGMPAFARLPVIGALGIGGWFLGGQIAGIKERKRAEKNVVIMDYVNRHPEQFPELNPKTYGESFMKWTPMR